MQECCYKKDDCIVYLLHPEQKNWHGCCIGLPPYFDEAYAILYRTWEQIKPFCEFIGMTFGASTYFLKLISYIKRKNKRKCKDVFYTILSKDEWTLSEIQNEFDVDKEKSKSVLKSLQYKWDRHKRKYIRTLDIDGVIEILNIKK